MLTAFMVPRLLTYGYSGRNSRTDDSITPEYETCKHYAPLNEHLIPCARLERKKQIKLRKRLDFCLRSNYNISCRSGTIRVRTTIAELCKGSTNDSDSFSPGSNPGSAAIICRHGQAVKTSPSHGENRGSSPRGGAEKVAKAAFFFLGNTSQYDDALAVPYRLREFDRGTQSCNYISGKLVI